MNISIFGLGYVGCVSLGCLAQNGHHVIGADVSKSKVDQINKGESTMVEKEIDEIFKAQHAAGRIKATQNFKEAKIKIIFFDDLKYKQDETLAGIYNFLEVDNTYNIKERETVDFQIGRKLNNIAYGLLGTKDGRTLINLIPKFVKNPLRKTLKAKTAFTLTNEERIYFRKRFSDDVLELENILNVNLGHWNPANVNNKIRNFKQ